jgi:hypothetical protein
MRTDALLWIVREIIASRSLFKSRMMTHEVRQ